MKAASRLLLILSVVMAVSVWAQTARTAAGKIQGRVVQRDTDEGAAGIAVVLSVLSPSGTTSSGRQVVTGADGRFAFDNVEPARYTLAASPVQSGRILITPTPVTIALTAGEQLQDVTFVATPTGTLSGRLLDPAGKPKEGKVYAVRPGYLRGRRVLEIITQNVASASTNKDGQFEIKGIEEDKEYLLAAVSSADQLTQFFPGVVDPADAIPVTVPRAGGNPLPDFRLVRPGNYTVNLKIPEPARAQTAPPARLILRIARYSRNGLLVIQVYGQTVKLDADRYTLSGLVPGLYEINYGWPGTTEDASFAVAVTDTDLDVDVTFPAPAKPGESRLYIKAEANADTNASPVERQLLTGELKYPRLKLSPLPDRLQALPTLGTFQSGGFFSYYRDGSVFLELPNGSYTVEPTLNPLLLPDSYVSAARYAGIDVLNAPLVFDFAASSRLDVTFGLKGARIEGVVQAGRNDPAWNATVVLFPADGRANTFGAVKTAVTDQHGRFEIRGVRPGSYGLLAWEGLEKGAYENPDFLAEYAQRQVHVQAEAGLGQSVTLQVQPKAYPGVLAAVSAFPVITTVGRPAETRPDGKARTRSPASADLAGIVTDIRTGKPVRDVAVFADGKEARTGADGRFKMEDVGTDSFLRVDMKPAPGYVVRDAFAGPRELEVRGSAPRNSFADVTFKPGERIDLVIHMESIAEVRGRLVDPSGQPTGGLEIIPIRQIYGTDGIPGPADGQVAWTDDKGEFVLRLEPGRYAFRIQFKLDVESGKTEAYTTSYYPSVSDPAKADWIDLAAGSETSLALWVLHRVQSTPVRLRLLRPDGFRTGCTPSFSIVARNKADPNDVREGRRPGPLPRFAADSEECVPELPPGAYDLLVSDVTVIGAQVSVDVKPGETPSVDVVLQDAVPVAGRVMLVAEDPAPGPRPVSGVRVQFHGYSSSQSVADGSFRLQRYAFQEYRLTVEAIPKGTYLKSITFGGRKTVGDTLSIGPTETGDVEILLGEAEETVVGRVLTSDGTAIPGALVVLIPLDRAALPTIAGETSRSGWFEIYVPAGRYRVFAWSSLTDKAFYNPEFMASRLSSGRPIEVPRHGRIDLRALGVLDDER